MFGDYLESEVRYSIRNEMAIKPNDIICRRIGIGFLNDKVSLEAFPSVSKIIVEGLAEIYSKEDIDILTEEGLKNFNWKL